MSMTYQFWRLTINQLTFMLQKQVNFLFSLGVKFNEHVFGAVFSLKSASPTRTYLTPPHCSPLSARASSGDKE